MGGIYALISMGMSLQYGVARILNISHGEFIMYGALLTWGLVLLGLPPFIAMIIVCPLTVVFGYLMHRLLYERLKRISKSVAVFEGNAILLAFGLMFIMQNTAARIWGVEPVRYSFMATSVTIGPSIFAANRVIVLCFAIVLSALFYFFLTKSRLGKAIRATAEDPVAAGLMGVNIKSVMAACFGIGAMMAGIAGSLISMIQSISTKIGMSYTLIAIIVVVLGGLGSVPGSLIGGVILGIVGTIMMTVQPSLTIVVFYAMIMILLLVRPKGLMGR